MLVLRPDNIGQTFLVPRRVTDFIPKNHIAYFIENLVEELDFHKINRKYRYTPGKSAYSRRMLIRLVIMASVDGVFSSRKIARLAEENVIYMYLSGMDKPDFRTICRFKVECSRQIEKAFEMTVNVAKNRGIVQLNHIAIDGTKIKANASKNNLVTQKEIHTIRELLKHGIEIDKEEDKIYGNKRGDEVPSELTNRQKVHEIVEKLKQENPELFHEKNMHESSFKLLEQSTASPEAKNRVLEKLDHAEEELEKTQQNTVSLSDPESRWMLNKKDNMEFSYNLQIAVDHDSGIILASTLTHEPTDHHQLIPQIERIQNTLGPLPDHTKISADNGYYTTTNLKYLAENDLDGYIPNRKQAHKYKKKNKSDKKYSKHNFKYNHENDFYLCPNNKKLTYQKTYKYNNAYMHQYYCNNCLKCQNQLECVGKDRLKVITNYGGNLHKQMEWKMETIQGRKEFAKRKEAAEWPFGNMKHNMKHTQFLTQGIKQTNTEKNLINTAHNIKRIHNIIQTKNKLNPKKINKNFMRQPQK